MRDTLSTDLLRNNGYCHLAALNTLRLGDLEALGVLRGHARMIMTRLLDSFLVVIRH